MRLVLRGGGSLVWSNRGNGWSWSRGLSGGGWRRSRSRWCWGDRGSGSVFFGVEISYFGLNGWGFIVSG